MIPKFEALHSCHLRSDEVAQSHRPIPFKHRMRVKSTKTLLRRREFRCMIPWPCSILRICYYLIFDFRKVLLLGTYYQYRTCAAMRFQCEVSEPLILWHKDFAKVEPIFLLYKRYRFLHFICFRCSDTRLRHFPGQKVLVWRWMKSNAITTTLTQKFGFLVSDIQYHLKEVGSRIKTARDSVTRSLRGMRYAFHILDGREFDLNTQLTCILGKSIFSLSRRQQN